jgi:hypothetical protein
MSLGSMVSLVRMVLSDILGVAEAGVTLIYRAYQTVDRNRFAWISKSGISTAGSGSMYTKSNRELHPVLVENEQIYLGMCILTLAEQLSNLIEEILCRSLLRQLRLHAGEAAPRHFEICLIRTFAQRFIDSDPAVALQFLHIVTCRLASSLAEEAELETKCRRSDPRDQISGEHPVFSLTATGVSEVASEFAFEFERCLRLPGESRHGYARCKMTADPRAVFFAEEDLNLVLWSAADRFLAWLRLVELDALALD